jgi:hypothetical protein
MKTEQFQLRGNNSVCAGAFQLLHGSASAQLRGNIDDKKSALYQQTQYKYVTKSGHKPNATLTVQHADMRTEEQTHK